jgi:adenosylcobinamide-phosphate synthase
MAATGRLASHWSAASALISTFPSFQPLMVAPGLNPLMISVAVCLTAVLLDRWLGEPRRWHPLVGFGHMVAAVEKRLNRQPQRLYKSVVLGCLAAALLILPVVGFALGVSVMLDAWALAMVEVLVLYLALSIRGLSEHGLAVAQALNARNIPMARCQVGRIVSRKADALDEPGIAAAATESMLENGADAVFASLFWYLVAGLPGVVCHRLVNTLDAMWGYRNERFLYFGRFAARLDDVLNWLPARFTALTYAVLGKTRLAVRCWVHQGATWDSPNAGPVMAAGAGALRVTLGGPAPYPTGIHNRPILGEGPAPTAESINAAIRLVHRGAWLWLAVLLAAAGMANLLATGG